MDYPNTFPERVQTSAEQSAYVWATLLVFGGLFFVVALLLGGPLYGVVALGVLAMPFLFRYPHASLWVSTIFMLLVTAFVPQEYAGDTDGTAQQLYAWAIGLFLITLPMVWSLPWRQLFAKARQRKVPLALTFFLLVTAAASLQGLRFAATLSYVLRQAYGALLLCVYFWAAIHFTVDRNDIAKNMRRIKLVGLAVGIITIIYWIGIEHNFARFKMDLATYETTLAAYCSGEFLYAKGAWNRLVLAAQAFIFFLHPVLFHSRGAVGVCGIVMLLGVGLLLPSRKAKLLALASVFMFLVLAIQTNIFAPLRGMMPDIGGAADLVPEDVIADPSFYSRIDQWITAIQTLRTHPILGTGLGSELEYFDPKLNAWAYRAIVDPGYAYLISKFGILGVIGFIWLMVSIARSSGWPERNGMHLGLFLVFVFGLLYMVDGAVMLHFLTAAWFGTVLGFLYQMRRLPEISPVPVKQ